MAFYAAPRFLWISICLGTRKFSAHKFTSSSSAQNFYNHLQENGGNIEKRLATVKAKLDHSCVSEVLQQCSNGQQRLGLRFFIWAAVQSNYRHSPFMYSKACRLFAIDENPGLIFDVIEDYKENGCLVSVRTFKVVLHLCKEAKLPNEALGVLRKMPEFNLHPDTIAYNVVLRLFCENSKMDAAEELMKEMGLMSIYPDAISYFVMIKGYCKTDNLEKAYGLVTAMKGHGCSPSAALYSLLLHWFCSRSTMERALEILDEMENKGGDCSPNVVTYTSVIQGFCTKGRSREALEILDRMESRGIFPNLVTARVLIQGFCSEGHLVEAFKLVHKVVAGGAVSYGECYSSLVLSLMNVKKLQEAGKLFNQMLASGVRPDGAACSVLIRELALQGRSLDGYHLCDEIEKRGFLTSIDSDVYSLLLVSLCEKQHSIEAAKLAKLMLRKGIRLKPSYVDSILKHLEDHGDQDLIRFLDGDQNRS